MRNSFIHDYRRDGRRNILTVTDDLSVQQLKNASSNLEVGKFVIEDIDKAICKPLSQLTVYLENDQTWIASQRRIT